MRPARALSALLLIALPALAAAEAPRTDERSFAERVPRAWCGVFRWDGDAREQHVTIRFERVAARPGGEIEAEGPGLVRYEDEPPERASDANWLTVLSISSWLSVFCDSSFCFI